ncbi:hypothetical protein TNCV_4854491 [Trichonephila clavipes]|nr:hypothetical protein TNCV_4854491 [Trichonephila clavipes]
MHILYSSISFKLIAKVSIEKRAGASVPYLLPPKSLHFTDILELPIPFQKAFSLFESQAYLHHGPAFPFKELAPLSCRTIVEHVETLMPTVNTNSCNLTR